MCLAGILGTMEREPTFKNLISGQYYRIVREFSDYDGVRHPVGEEWVFLSQSFLPYDDGLTLKVKLADGNERRIRLQWRPDGQSELIEKFGEFVIPIESRSAKTFEPIVGIDLPDGMDVRTAPSGALLCRGTAEALLQLGDSIQRFGGEPAPRFAEFCGWTFCSVEYRSETPAGTLAMSPSGWRILGSKLKEVATGREDSLFRFGDAGLFWPPVNPDVEVELIGRPLAD